MRMSKDLSCSLGFGVVLILIGIIAIVTRLNDVIIEHVLSRELSLLNGSMGYELWRKVDLEFKVYLFHIVNPKEVQTRGDVANLVEYGPYVYDEHVEKIVVGVNESADTIDYMTRRTLLFSAKKSGNLSENDQVTILNPAYLGIILTLASTFPTFIGKIGNNIALLFSDPESIFVRGQVRDILFDGLPMTCDTKAHPELSLICSFLKTKRPPILRTTPIDGVYAYSFFNKMNGTEQGPFTVSRGTKDRYMAGYLSRFKNLPYAVSWNSKNCSAIKGSDSIFWPPMRSRLPHVFTYIIDLCRSLHADYYNDSVYNGLSGYHYRTSNSLWNGSEASCYCPRASNGTMVCPTRGLLDIKKCQEAPVIMSEPHFLHGSSSLRSIIKGLHPNEEKHATYVVVEPMTGAPLSGFKKMQLNMMMQQQPVRLLSNVSYGVLPMLWVEEGSSPGPKVLQPVILVHRLSRVLAFIACTPLPIGILFLVYSYWMKKSSATRNYRKVGTIGGRTPRNTPN